MILLPLSLVLISAFFHSFWNMLVKRSGDKTLFTFLTVWTAVAVYTPFVLVLQPRLAIPWQGWACILGTGTVYCFYFLLLPKSYDLADLSIAYPLARGLVPALTVVWAYSFLGERPSLVGWSGITLVISSIYLFHAREMSSHSAGMLEVLRTSLSAIATGISTSIYSIVDKVGVSFVDPVLYIYLTFLFAAVALSPVFLIRYGASRISSHAKEAGIQILTSGSLCIFAYLAVLFSMRMAAVSYILPLRSTSILFAVLLGLEVLGERRTWIKAAATAAMLAGVLLIALA